MQSTVGDWYAGVAFEHIPNFHVRVFVPPGADRQAFEKVAGDYDDELKIVFEDVEYTSRELRARLAEAADATLPTVDDDKRNDLAGVGFVDEVQQAVVIQVAQKRILPRSTQPLPT